MIDYDRIPERLMISMKGYVEQRRRPGHFLSAVICNNLTEAVGRADDESLSVIADIVGWFYNKAPSDCWGSPQKMEDWLKGFMKYKMTVDEIKQEIEKIDSDDRYHYPPADVFVNAPLALIQVQMEARVRALSDVLGIKPPKSGPSEDVVE